MEIINFLSLTNSCMSHCRYSLVMHATSKWTLQKFSATFSQCLYTVILTGILRRSIIHWSLRTVYGCDICSKIWASLVMHTYIVCMSDSPHRRSAVLSWYVINMIHKPKCTQYIYICLCCHYIIHKYARAHCHYILFLPAPMKSLLYAASVIDWLSTVYFIQIDQYLTAIL